MADEARKRVQRELNEIHPKAALAHAQLAACRDARRALRAADIARAHSLLEEARAIREGQRPEVLARPMTDAELEELMDMRLAPP